MICCPACRHVIAYPRGVGKVRFVPLKVLVVREGEDGSQSLETTCPRCRADVPIRLPIQADAFKRTGSVLH